MKTYALTIVAFIFLTVPVSSWAEKAQDEKVKTFACFRDDWVKTEGKESFHSQEFLVHWTWKKIGAGINVVTVPKKDFILVKPFATFKIADGPIFLVGGPMTTSSSDYLHGGIWIITKLNQFDVFIDLREYVEISGGENSDYLDFFWEITYPILNKYSLGVAGFYDYWWQDNGHDQLLIGPVGLYHFSETSSFFIRPSYDWESQKGETKRTAKVRAGMRFIF